MSDTATSTDPYEALADELGRLGERLGGMGAELRALRTAGAPGAAEDTGPAAAGKPDGPDWAETVDLRRPAATAQPPAGPSTGRPAAPLPDRPPATPAASGWAWSQDGWVWTQPGWRWTRAGWTRTDAARGGGATGGAERSAVDPGTGPRTGPPGQARSPWSPPAAPARRRLPALSGARLLAWTGGAVTLLGVVLLLVLAASRGWFSPPFRIAGGAVLGVVLIGVAARLHRRPSARTGALAVAATGFATLYLVVAAATALYDYLPALPALVLALVVAGTGLGLADRWRSQLLGSGVVVGAAVLAPALATDWLLVALALALQVAALPVVLRRGWPVLMLVAAAGPVLYGLIVGGLDVGGGHLPTIAVVLGALAVGLGTAVPAARLVVAGSRPLGEHAVSVLVAASALPALVTGSALDGWPGAALTATAALALAATAAATAGALRLVAVATAVVCLLQATLIALDGSAAATVVLAEAVLTAVVATLTRSRFSLVMAMVLGLFGVLGALVAAELPPVWSSALPDALTAADLTAVLVTRAGIGALVVALAVALLLAGGRVGWARPDAATAGLWVPVGLVGLYGAGTLVVTLALLISPDRAGFTAGHAVVTVSWTVVALVLLARGITRPALRVTGLVLVAAAVAKLVLFDLVALDGIARVAAFLGAGLLLLAAGARYARLVAEADPDAGRDTPPAGATRT